MADLHERIRAKVADVEKRDAALAAEMEKVRGNERTANEARTVVERMRPKLREIAPEGVADDPGPGIGGLAQETIVLRTGRPVLSIVRGAARLEFRDRDSEVWRQRLTDAQALIGPAIQAVGRVELRNNPRFDWVGTGWLVAEDIVVTNRHVANEFAQSNGGRFDFQASASGRMEASIDFLEEIERSEDFTVRVDRVLHVEGARGPDVAFLKLKRDSRQLARPIGLSSARAARDQFIAVIGYPARDSRIPEEDLMDEIFGNVYNKKRLAPGQVAGTQNGQVLHDCSTLGGNSGSAIIDLRSGQALGLHFAGRFLEANFAVPADVVAERLKAVMEGRARPQPASRAKRDGETDTGAGAPMARMDAGGTGGQVTSFTIPIRVTVSVGAATADRSMRPPPAAGLGPVGPEEDVEDIDEAPRDPAEYDNRDGYDGRFLGDDARVELPELGAALRQDVVTFARNGQTEHVLPYRHFSVVMSRSRRLCLYSAVNVDGKNSRKMKRVGWRLDPRILRESQILKECYGSAPKFSRGHMTRREDPIWGAVPLAAQGNEDSMHATNAVPQMQPFNAGIWLGLEDYALENARQDDMRISVFTGPFLARNDPIRFGVKIPRSFWKVIAFIHDDTDELCATGYTMSQNSFLVEEEVIFGQHEMAQRPISTIEARTGLSFGNLAAADPLAGGEETLERPLTDFSQIRFV
jgi:endonuclease G